MGNTRSGFSMGDNYSVVEDRNEGNYSSAASTNYQLDSMHCDTECSRTGPPIEQPPVSAIKYIERGPGFPVSIRGFDEMCEFGNYVRMTGPNAYRLQWLVGEKQTPIPCYVCTMKKTFVCPNNRLYFSVYFTSTYLAAFTKQSAITIKSKIGHVRNKDTVKLTMGPNKLGTVGSNWSRFAASTEIKEGDICVFSFRVKKGLLRIRMDVL